MTGYRFWAFLTDFENNAELIEQSKVDSPILSPASNKNGWTKW